MKASVFIPVVTVSELNRREHWGDRARRVRMHRSSAFMLVRSALGFFPDHRAVVQVVMTRSGRNSLDEDNLEGALKAVRDGIADALKRNDNDPRLLWGYQQKTGRPYGVLVELEVTG